MALVYRCFIWQGADEASAAGQGLALNKLPTGKYNCQVTVVDPTSQKASFWQAPIMLVP